MSVPLPLNLPPDNGGKDWPGSFTDSFGDGFDEGRAARRLVVSFKFGKCSLLRRLRVDEVRGKGFDSLQLPGDRREFLVALLDLPNEPGTVVT